MFENGKPDIVLKTLMYFYNFDFRNKFKIVNCCSRVA